MAYYTRAADYWAEFAAHGLKKKILFEGDSWFSIPDIANIPIQIDSTLDLSILCTAAPGDRESRRRGNRSGSHDC